MDWTECKDIEIVPGKVSGVPILIHSRVPVDSILDSADAGESPEDIAYSFDLPTERVQSVLAFAASHLLKSTA